MLGKQNVTEEFAESLQFCARPAAVIAETLKRNSRQVERFLNAFILRENLAKVARPDDIKDDALMKLMLLEDVQTERFRELFKWQAEDNGSPKVLAAMDVAEAKAPIKPASWMAPEVRKWLAVAPSLASVDLRDYFWVARDRLASTFTGVSLVSPAVRRVFEDALLAPKRHVAATSAKSFTDNDRNALFGLLEQQAHRSPADARAREKGRPSHST